MIPSPAVQHRVKHFDLLLARELVLLGRIHEQNLLTQEKLEKTIRRDNQLLDATRKRTSIMSNGTFEHHKMPLLTKKNSDEKSHLSGSSITNNQDQTEETITPRRYRRACFKAHRLPPIVKANVSNRKKRSSKDLHWFASFQQAEIQDENVSDIATTIIEEELPKTTLPKLTPMQQEIHSFLESLPIYKGAHRGFDNFAPSSLYSTRAQVAMR